MSRYSPEPVSSVYVHVPFCAHKCEYCAFFSEAANGEAVNQYVTALVRELELVAGDLEPRTVFFGGGTPSLLNLRQWQTVLQAMQRLELLGAGEWTVECNPATVSRDKALLLRSFGVNRVSMGVQSLDEALLDRLGRIHSRDMVFKSFDILRAAGFDNVNLDLMFAIPGQTMPVWRETMREAIAMGSEHLSCYEVIYEQDTPLFEQLDAGEFSVDEDLACAMYDELIAVAGENGFEQYEIANFARDDGREKSNGRRTAEPVDAHRSAPPPHSPDPKIQHPKSPGTAEFTPSRACRHNVAYWRGGCYHGLGPSAAGFVRGTRTKNVANTRVYCSRLSEGARAIDWSESLPPLASAGEIAAFGLRMNAGWPLAEFKERTGYDLAAEWAAEIGQLIEMGHGQLDAERFRLTPAGMRFADRAAEQFLRPGATYS